MAALRIAALVLLAGCVGTEGPSPTSSGGTLVISAGASPDVLIPGVTSSALGLQISDLVYDRLADIGDALNIVGDRGFTPRLADRWTWSSDSLSIAFHIDPRARWHDGKPVVADDVRFTFASNRDSTMASSVYALLGNIDSVTAPDSSTAVFWFRARAPQQFYDAVYLMPILPAHLWRDMPVRTWRASAQARAPVGSGRYRFVRWIPQGSVELAADTMNYFGAPKLSRVIWSLAPDFNVAVTRFMSGEADFFEALRPENVSAIRNLPQLRRAQTKGLAYSFAQLNLRDPANRARPHALFGDRELRRALTMGVDRRAIVRSVYDTLAAPTLGPTVRMYATTDPNLSQIPFDVARARAVLDSLGWRDADGDGIRERNGRPLQFTVSAPGSSAARVRMAVLIQEQLRQLGVKVDVEQLDYRALLDKIRRRTFDVFMSGVQTQPSPGAVRQSWGTAGSRARDGSNYGSYENPVFDAYIDSALASSDLPVRRALFTKAYRVIIEDAPAIWLAEPIPTLGYHSRLQIVRMRPDAWWANIGEWSIPADKRIPRDNLPAAAPLSPPPSSADTAGRKAP
jgi:peptide/nickel transport system substrate-binding protein